MTYKIGDKVKVLVSHYNNGASCYVLPGGWNGPKKGDIVVVKEVCDYPGMWIDSQSVERETANRYFEEFELVEEEKVNKKFKEGDKVISTKNTPSIPEGFIGFVTNEPFLCVTEYDYAVESINSPNGSGLVELFREDELELLSVGKRETKFNPPLSETENYNFPDTITPQDIAGVSKSALDKQVSGNHYKDCKIQPVEYIQANGLSYLEGNVIKYTTRHSKKNGKADIEKAIHYLELILEMEYKDKE